MSEFTAEQEAEIQKRVNEARAQQKQFEQYRLAADQFFRLAITHVADLAARGTVSPYVTEVGKDQYTRFLAAFFPESAPAPDQKPDGAADDGQQE